MPIPDQQRIVITGMSVNTPLGDTLDGLEEALFAGRSAITRWRGVDTSRIYTKIGGDLTDYDFAKKIASLKARGDEAAANRFRALPKRLRWNVRLTALLALDAYADAAFETPPAAERFAAIVAGHNLNAGYTFSCFEKFTEDPDFIDPFIGLSVLDTTHAGIASEILGIRGPIHTVGAACASGNVALRSAIDEIRHHDVDAVLVLGAVIEFSPIELHSMALMGAVSFKSFNDEPERASRPFDVRREGFVAAQGGAALMLESLAHARARGARIYAEVLCVTASSDGNHQTQPSEDGQAALMVRALREAGIAPEQIDYINTHATSTPIGDLTEIRAIKRAFGAHAYALKLNATKSMLGHTCWASPTVETVASVLQMRAGRLHPSINIDQIEPEVDLDVCAGRVVDHPVRHVLKNSFGFGGINSVSILKVFDE
ncbi:MAG: beta-ketoacyl-[acyl-carrier-protein] synthase family protein [Chthoniobacteraceae bacterium]